MLRLRSPDTLSTIVGSSSQLIAPAAEHEDPSRSMRRVVFEGYYGMRKQDVLWCELAEIEEAMPMVKWMASALPVNSSGTVAIEDCRAELLVGHVRVAKQVGVHQCSLVEVCRMGTATAEECDHACNNPQPSRKHVAEA